jgi:polyisoprenoid-binding protein YceI
MSHPHRLASRAAVLVGLILSTALRAEDIAWRIDTNHSAAHFSVRHLMISTVRGEFSGISGMVRYDARHPAQASVEATVDCRTLNTGVAKRDEQMKGPDFFEVKKYPNMVFKSKRVQTAGKDKLKVTGDLTINNTTREVVIEVDGPSPQVKDAQGRMKIGLNATARINRKDFGIVWNEVLDNGGVAVADQVVITLDIELVKN